MKHLKVQGILLLLSCSIILIGLRHIAMGCQPSFKDHLKGILKIFHEIVGVLLAMDLASFISSVGAITSPN
jgi:hypothetical protein